MNHATSLEGLNARLEELERRVAMLERGQEALAPEPAVIAPKPEPLLPALSIPQSTGFFSTMGKAMLGIAGAYLLRAMAESHWAPEALLAPLAILYALAWMAAAGRVARTTPRIVYACTSVLILAPMLWELTLRFHVLAPWADALALVAMAAVAFASTRAADSAAISRIANLAVAALALVLAIATHSNLPFLAALLLLVMLCEYTELRGKIFGARRLVVLAADLGVWLLIYIYRGPHADYPEIGAAALIAPGFVLFTVAAVSTSVRMYVRHERSTAFETVQTAIAFLLASCGLLFFGPAGRFVLLGGICLALAAAAYTAFFRVQSTGTNGKNRAELAAWSAALLLAGSFLCVPAQWRAEWLGLSAMAATSFGVRTLLLSLAVQGNAFLLASTIASGLGAYAWRMLAGTPTDTPPMAVFFVLICAAGCFGILRLRDGKFAQAVSYLYLAVASLAISAMLTGGILALAALRLEPASHHLALFRSFSLCAVALVLALGGTVWRRKELMHVAYVVVAVEALKLIAEDLRHGHLVYMAVSVCMFAITLIALPRVARRASPQA